MKKSKQALIEEIVNKISVIIISSISLIISFFIVKLNGERLNEISIFEDGFVINALIVLLGFTLTVITYIYTSYERIIKILNSNNINSGKAMVIEISKEIKEDIYFIFRVLVLTIVLISIKNSDIPYLKWNFKLLSKIELYEVLKISGFFLALYSVWDLIKAIIRIIDINYFN